MIKKFEAYNPKKLDTQFIIDAFVEFIDENNYYYKEDGYFQINIETPLAYKDINIRNVIDVNKWVKSLDDYIENNRAVLDKLEDINIAIKRVKDELGILPVVDEIKNNLIIISYGDWMMRGNT